MTPTRALRWLAQRVMWGGLLVLLVLTVAGCPPRPPLPGGAPRPHSLPSPPGPHVPGPHLPGLP